jgi:hypothetical protein
MAAAFEYCERVYPQYEFVGEDIFEVREKFVGVEDAQLMDGDRVARRVIEHGGRYRKERLIHFHKHVTNRNLPYSLF